MDELESIYSDYDFSLPEDFNLDVGSLGANPDFGLNFDWDSISNFMADPQLFAAFAELNPEDAALLKDMMGGDYGFASVGSRDVATGEGDDQLGGGELGKTVEDESAAETERLKQQAKATPEGDATGIKSGVPIGDPNDPTGIKKLTNISEDKGLLDKGKDLIKNLTGLDDKTINELGKYGLLAGIAKLAYDDAEKARQRARGWIAPGGAAKRSIVGPKGHIGYTKAAQGGVMSLAEGGDVRQPFYLGGSTDGMTDEVPAHIDGKRPAALSDGEFVIPADVVSHLGNGNSNAGAQRLYEMMDQVRQARTGTTKQGKQINPEDFTKGVASFAGGGSVFDNNSIQQLALLAQSQGRNLASPEEAAMFATELQQANINPNSMSRYTEGGKQLKFTGFYQTNGEPIFSLDGSLPANTPAVSKRSGPLQTLLGKDLLPVLPFSAGGIASLAGGGTVADQYGRNLTRANYEGKVDRQGIPDDDDDPFNYNPNARKYTNYNNELFLIPARNELDESVRANLFAQDPTGERGLLEKAYSAMPRDQLVNVIDQLQARDDWNVNQAAMGTAHESPWLLNPENRMMAVGIKDDIIGKPSVLLYNPTHGAGVFVNPSPRGNFQFSYLSGDPETDFQQALNLTPFEQYAMLNNIGYSLDKTKKQGHYGLMTEAEEMAVSKGLNNLSGPLPKLPYQELERGYFNPMELNPIDPYAKKRANPEIREPYKFYQKYLNLDPVDNLLPLYLSSNPLKP